MSQEKTMTIQVTGLPDALMDFVQLCTIIQQCGEANTPHVLETVIRGDLFGKLRFIVEDPGIKFSLSSRKNSIIPERIRIGEHFQIGE